jgi:SAM-dependent methyltransferase
MKTRLLPGSAVGVLKRHTRLYQAARRTRMGVGKLIPPRRLDGIPGRVHFNDFMLEDDSPAGIEKYRTQALNVVSFIERALAAAGREYSDVESWLDFGCGYGRVLRFLVDHVDPRKVWVSDVIDEGVRFCSAEFGVHPARSTAAFDTLDLGRHDFIYAISVLTHLPAEAGRDFLGFLGRSLNPGGIALFTSHGRWSLDNLGFYDAAYESRRSELEQAVAEDGVAFVPYHHYPGGDYGMTWHSRERIEEMVRELHGDGLKLLFHEPHGLDGHQDVFAYQRRK